MIFLLGKKYIAIFITNHHLEKLSVLFFLAILFLWVSLLTEVGWFFLLQCLPVLVWFWSQVWPGAPRDLDVCWPLFFLIVTAEQQEEVTWDDEELLQLVVEGLTTEFLTSEPPMTVSVWRLCSQWISWNVTPLTSVLLLQSYKERREHAMTLPVFGYKTVDKCSWWYSRHTCWIMIFHNCLYNIFTFCKISLFISIIKKNITRSLVDN